ncbi:B3 domain-containing protein At2g32645-like [Rutidosis leptorrhynchoides]|uniref:B3 domain-containing protein At2g32645-like n=1 Tax=Rutidosis leptorrhynchoides TaxID=125765 RepID=UPI003A9A5858
MAPIRRSKYYCGLSTSNGICSGGTEHHDYDDTKNEEEEKYIRKIQELVNEKMELFTPKENEFCEKIKKKKIKPNKRPARMSSVEEDYWNKRLRNIINHKQVVPLVYNDVTKRLKKFIENEMNGSEINVLIQKHITESDTRRNLNRLNMPMLQVLTHDFLTEDEKHYLDMNMEIEVPLVGPNLRMYEELMDLKVWSMSSSKNYVLKRCWFDFWEKNEVDLKEGELIQVWSFRIENRLCFAIACVNKPVTNMKVEN